jgi:predicted RNA-binding protein (virulence factor B family)
MADIGRFNHLNILRISPLGAHLDGGLEKGRPLEILLPARLVPADSTVGMALNVFLYIDAENRLTATTLTPLVQVGEVAFLKIVSVNDNGAFLHWGLPKDLLLPHNEVTRELKHLLEPGRKIMVMVFQDDQGRIAASARLNDFLTKEGSGFSEGNKVSVVIGDYTELGITVIVNNRYWGLVHHNEVFRPLHKGEMLEGYIKTVREDRKLNISLTAPGHGKVDTVAQNILDTLKSHGGFMAVSDKSPPELIYKLFGVSKKVFKQSIGSLYRDRKITIESASIKINE